MEEVSLSQQNEITEKYSQMGFSISAITRAWEVSDGTEESFQDFLFNLMK